MGIFGSRIELLQPEEVDELVEISNFNRTEINILFDRFITLDRTGKGYISGEDLEKLPELAMNPLLERILDHFQLTQGGTINFTQFVKQISIFSREASEVAKLRAAFDIFDQDKDGFITEKELKRVLKLMVGEHSTNEEVDKAVQKILEEGDKDGDGKLSLLEFKNTLGDINIHNKFTFDIENEE
eukprot:maker-scaffold_11-snap-gene-1.49-mRNA-1 protein AED:0.01 eAED:0.01 QI:122/1/1/1/1/1/2/280/184